MRRVCKHCGEEVELWECRREPCTGKRLTDVCRECHRETAHGIIPRVYVNCCGNRTGYREDDAQYFPWR